MDKPTSPSPSTPRLPQILRVRYATKPLTKKRRIILFVCVVLVALFVTGFTWYKWGFSSQAFIDGGKYQAVFTANNQAYFGKMQRLSDGAYRLTDVYYLQQSGSTAQKPDSTGQTPQLVKMGSELHGPEDAVIFPPEQVLFWENLKNDGKVAKAIDDYSKK